MKWMLALFVVAGCTSAPPPMLHFDDPPAELTSCPPAAPTPPTPGKVRTTEAIAHWATALDHALTVSDAALAECTARLKELNRWITEQRIEQRIEHGQSQE